MSEPGGPRIIATVRDATELVAVLRARAEELQIPRDTLDERAGLAKGHASKILAMPSIKRIGPVSMFPMIGALGMGVLLVEDMAMMKLVARQRKRQPSGRTPRDHGRNTKALRMLQEIARITGSIGGRLSCAKQSKAQISKQRSKAAKSRWRKWRTQRAFKAQVVVSPEYHVIAPLKGLKKD